LIQEIGFIRNMLLVEYFTQKSLQLELNINRASIFVQLLFSVVLMYLFSIFVAYFMKQLLSLFILFLLVIISKAQNVNSDFGLLSENVSQPNTFKASYYTGEKNTQDAMKSVSKFSAYNPLFLLGKVAMYGYQNIISPQLFRDCPYEITCSNYCKIAIQHKGIFIGTFIGAERLLRCNRMSMLDVQPNQQNSTSNKIIDGY